MIVPLSWSRSTSQRRIIGFVIFDTALPLLGAGASFAIGAERLWLGQDALANLILGSLLLAWSGLGLFVMFVALFGFNTDREMEAAGYDKMSGCFRQPG